MRDSRPPVELDSTLQFVLAADIPLQHRTVLVELLTRALREQGADASGRASLQTAGSMRMSW
jgi:hypothetical protein